MKRLFLTLLLAFTMYPNAYGDHAKSLEYAQNLDNLQDATKGKLLRYRAKWNQQIQYLDTPDKSVIRDLQEIFADKKYHIYLKTADVVDGTVGATTEEYLTWNQEYFAWWVKSNPFAYIWELDEKGAVSDPALKAIVAKCTPNIIASVGCGSGEAPLSKYIDIVSESNRYYFRIGDSSLPEVKGEVVLDFCSDTVSPKWRFIVAEDKGNLITNSTFYMSDGKPIRSYEVEPFQKDNIWLPQHWTRIDYDASSGETNRLVASELLEFEIISDPDAHEFQWDSIPFPDGTKVMTFTKSGQWTTKLRAGEELVPMQVYFEAQELLRDSREQKGE